MVCEHRGRINSSDVIIVSPLPKFASWNNSSIAVGTDNRISKTQTISGCVLTTVTSYRREVHEGAVINFQSSHPSPLPVRPLPLRNLTSLPHVGRRQGNGSVTGPPAGLGKSLRVQLLESTTLPHHSLSLWGCLRPAPVFPRQPCFCLTSALRNVPPTMTLHRPLAARVPPHPHPHSCSWWLSQPRRIGDEVRGKEA